MGDPDHASGSPREADRVGDLAASLRLAAASFKSAVAQRPVILAAQVANLVQQGPGDRAVELGLITDGAEEIAAVKHDRAVGHRAARAVAVRAVAIGIVTGVVVAAGDCAAGLLPPPRLAGTP